jgi:hypothetical protein
LNVVEVWSEERCSASSREGSETLSSQEAISSEVRASFVSFDVSMRFVYAKNSGSTMDSCGRKVKKM